MRRRFSIGACVVALAGLLAITATSVSADNRHRGEGRSAQSSSVTSHTSRAAGGHSYRRHHHKRDRRGGISREAAERFQAGHSYRRDDRRDVRREYGYRHHKHHHENRMTVEGKSSFGSRYAPRRHGEFRGRGRSTSSVPPIVIEVNPWLAE